MSQNSLPESPKPTDPALDSPDLAQNFIADSIHEFRNRLTGLSYAAEALEAELVEGSTNGALSFLQILRHSILQTHRHFNNFLLAQDLARTSIQPILTNTPLDDLLSTVLSHPNIAPSSHRIDVRFTPGLAIRANRQLFNVLLLHLVENALQFSPQDSRIQIVVTATPQDVTIGVLDHGPGTPPHLATSANPTPHSLPSAPAPKRRGLGLYIAQMIAAAHNATFSLQPNEGGGTLAQLLIPRP